MFVLILIGLLFVVFGCYHCYRLKGLPPVADGFCPIIGHSLVFVTTTNLFALIETHINKLLERKIYSFTISLGPWNFHGVIDPDDAFVVANSCLTKDVMYDFFRPFFGEGLITAGVSKWKIHRKLLNPTFNQQVLDGFLSEFNYQTQQLIDSISVEVGRGPFDHTKYVTDVTVKIVCGTTLGSSVGKEEEKTLDDFVKAENDYLICLVHRVTRFWLHSDWIYSLTGFQKKHDMLVNIMKIQSHAILEKKKTEYENNKTQNINPNKRFKSFMELLLESSEDGGLSEQEIFDELNTFFVAGSDTISSALSNILTCLGSYLSVQERVKHELQEVFQGSDRDVEKDDLSKLKYLEAVVKETLRLYPPVPLFGRVLDKDIQIKGYTLPAGSNCYVVSYGVLRHPTWGPDANQFRPERWIDGSLPSSLKAFAVFGIGKRSCIGSNFSIMCMKTVLASLLRRYSVTSDITQMVQDFAVITKPVSGHHIAIERIPTAVDI